MSYPEENDDRRGHLPFHEYDHPDGHTHGWRPTVPLLDIVKPSRGRVGPSVNPDAEFPIRWIVVIAIIVGLILGWVTAPFGIVPS